MNNLHIGKPHEPPLRDGAVTLGPEQIGPGLADRLRQLRATLTQNSQAPGLR